MESTYQERAKQFDQVQRDLEKQCSQQELYTELNRTLKVCEDRTGIVLDIFQQQLQYDRPCTYRSYVVIVYFDRFIFRSVEYIEVA